MLNAQVSVSAADIKVESGSKGDPQRYLQPREYRNAIYGTLQTADLIVESSPSTSGEIGRARRAPELRPLARKPEGYADVVWPTALPRWTPIFPIRGEAVKSRPWRDSS